MTSLDSLHRRHATNSIQRNGLGSVKPRVEQKCLYCFTGKKAELKLVCMALNLRRMGAMRASLGAKCINIAKITHLGLIELVFADFADFADCGDVHVNCRPDRMNNLSINSCPYKFFWRLGA